MRRRLFRVAVVVAASAGLLALILTAVEARIDADRSELVG
jgi:hypothetical protein